MVLIWFDIFNAMASFKLEEIEVIPARCDMKQMAPSTSLALVALGGESTIRSACMNVSQPKCIS